MCLEDDKSELIPEVLPISLNSTSLVDVVKSIRSDDLPSLDISELSADIQSHIIDKSAAYYVADFWRKCFLQSLWKGAFADICCMVM